MPRRLGGRTPVVRSPTLPANGPGPAPRLRRVRRCHVSWRRERSARGPGPPTRSRTPKYYPDPLAGREQTPRLSGSEAVWGVRSRHASAGAGPRRGAALSQEDTPTYRIQYGRRKCALPQQSPRRLLPGCTIDRALPRRAVQPLAPPTHAS